MEVEGYKLKDVLGEGRTGRVYRAVRLAVCEGASRGCATFAVEGLTAEQIAGERRRPEPTPRSPHAPPPRLGRASC